MSKSYYEASRDELIKRLECLSKRNYVDFFRESSEFELAISLAYFSLAEEMLVEKDSKDFNIATRLKKNIDDMYLNGLLTEDINIRDKEVDGNSVEWFLSALRNGIMHNGFLVDYDDKVVNVWNDGALNKLDCSVSFDWFKKFITDDLLLKSTIDSYKYTVVFNPFVRPENAMPISNYAGIRDFIEHDLPAYDILISLDKSNGNQEKIRRDEFIKFCYEREQLFWNLMNMPERLKQEDIDKFNEYKVKTEKRLESEKSSLSSREYDKKYYKELFSEWFTDEFMREYPQYTITISDFDRESPKLNMVVNGLKDYGFEKQLFPTQKKRKEFLNQHPVFQRMDISSAVSRVVNYDRVDYLNALQYLFSMYDMHKGAVRDEYGLSKFMGKILRSNYTNNQQIQADYIKAIHDGMVEEGIAHNYNKQITERLIRLCDDREEDIYIRCRELCDEFKDDSFDEELQKISDILSSEYPDIYQVANEQLKSNNVPSDQVLAVYNENDLYRLCNAKGVINNQMDEIIIGLLYTLGINTYVVNKETVFEDFDEDDYSFMDGLNIKGYSKDAYTNLCDVRDRKKSHYDSLRGINKNIANLVRALGSLPDGDEKTRLTKLKKQRDEEAKEEQTEVEKCQDFINNTNTEVFGNVSMASLSNLACATTIRNCFAHSGRIFVDGREPGGEVRLVLTDYDENGNLSGVVKTDLSSMIKFFGSSVFKNEMDKKEEVSVEKSK